MHLSEFIEANSWLSKVFPSSLLFRYLRLLFLKQILRISPAPGAIRVSQIVKRRKTFDWITARLSLSGTSSRHIVRRATIDRGPGLLHSISNGIPGICHSPPIVYWLGAGREHLLGFRITPLPFNYSSLSSHPFPYAYQPTIIISTLPGDRSPRIPSF